MASEGSLQGEQLAEFRQGMIAHFSKYFPAEDMSAQFDIYCDLFISGKHNLEHISVDIIDFGDKMTTEDIYGGRYCVADVSEVLDEYLRIPIADHTEAQRDSTQKLRQMLQDDRDVKDFEDIDPNVPRSPWGGAQKMNWWWSQKQIDEMLHRIDQIFFNGAVLKHVTADVVGDLAQSHNLWGQTRTNLLGTTIKIELHNMLSENNWESDNSARGRFLATAAHELLHAVFCIKVCKCVRVCVDDVTNIQQDGGHGDLWQVSAQSLSKLFLQLFSDLIDIASGDQTMAIDPIYGQSGRDFGIDFIYPALLRDTSRRNKGSLSRRFRSATTSALRYVGLRRPSRRRPRDHPKP